MQIPPECISAYEALPTQQTPNAPAHPPSLVPPVLLHSLAVIHVPDWTRVEVRVS